MEYLSKFNEAVKDKDIDAKIEILEDEVIKGSYAPAVYDKLARIYEKELQYYLSYSVCVRWFELDYWKLPDTSVGSIMILNRLKRLEKRGML